jgi:hypothetical protein
MYAQSVQNLFSTLSWLQNPVAIKLCIRIDRMSNQRKSEFIHGKFHVQCSWEGHGEMSSKSWLAPKGIVCPDFCFSWLVEFPTIVTHKSLTDWSHIQIARKLKELPTIVVFGTFRVLVNPKPKSWGMFSRCSVQKQNSAAKLIFKIS